MFRLMNAGIGYSFTICSLLVLGIALSTEQCSSQELQSAQKLQSQVSTPQTSGTYASFASPSGEIYFALRLKMDGSTAKIAAKTTEVVHHVVMVDTSASQVGEHREHAMEVLTSLLKSLPVQDKVSLVAVDVQVEPLVKGFVSLNDPLLQEGLNQLADRTPLGSTNLLSSLKHAISSLEEKQRGSVLYLGDGMSTAHVLQAEELKSLTASFVSNQIPIHSFGVGPQIDKQLLGILAHQTGGVCYFDSLAETPAKVGKTMALATQQDIFYPKEISTSPKLKLLPATPLPLRSDRETIYLGKTDSLGKLTVSATGVRNSVRNSVRNQQAMQPSWTIAKPQNNIGDSYLMGAWKYMDSTAGLSNNLAGVHMLSELQDQFNIHIDQIADLGERAAQSRNIDEVAHLGRTLENLDPGNKRAALLLKTAAELQAGRQQIRLAQNTQPAVQPPATTQPPSVAPNNDAFDGQPNDDRFDNAGPKDPNASNLLNELKERERIINEQMQTEVSARIQRARGIVDTNPDQAIQMIKHSMQRVRETTDMSPEVSQQLYKQLGRVLNQLENQKEEIEQRQRRVAERQATLEAERNVLDKLQAEEENIEQLVDQVRALLQLAERGEYEAYDEARYVSEAIMNLKPGSPPAIASYITSGYAGRLNKAERLWALKAERFMETLYQVELSHMPFPDEPPILWPPAEEWRALTLRRKKWESVDLHKMSPAEERIQSALGTETEVEFLDTSLTDAMTFLGDQHNIQIILDELALSEEGLQPDEPITRTLSGVSLRSALRIILQPLGLQYVIQDEVMKITTVTAANDLEKYGSTRVYPVGDLVIPIITPVSGGLGQGFGGIGGFGGGGNGQSQFGPGAAGFGGGQGGVGGGFGGGFGGGNVFAIPPEQLKAPMNGINGINGINQNGPQIQLPGLLRGRIQHKPAAKPKKQIQNQEAKELLDDVLGNKPGNKVGMKNTIAGQSFAQIRDLPQTENQPFRLDNNSVNKLKKKAQMNQ